MTACIILGYQNIGKKKTILVQHYSLAVESEFSNIIVMGLSTQILLEFKRQLCVNFLFPLDKLYKHDKLMFFVAMLMFSRVHFLQT